MHSLKVFHYITRCFVTQLLMRLVHEASVLTGSEESARRYGLLRSRWVIHVSFHDLGATNPELAVFQSWTAFACLWFNDLISHISQKYHNETSTTRVLDNHPISHTEISL